MQPSAFSYQLSAVRTRYQPSKLWSGLSCCHSEPRRLASGRRSHWQL